MANKAVKGELQKIAEATAALDEDKDPKESVGMIEGAVAKIKALFKEAFPPKKEDESEDESEDEAKAKAKAAEKGEDETEDESEDESEDEAMRADDAVDGKDGDDEDDEEEPEKKGSKSVVHIKHEERRTQTESARALRDATKELKEAQATIAKLTKRLAAVEVKEMVESGLPEDFAKALQDLPAAQRKSMRLLAGMIESGNGGFAGPTARGTSVKESKPGDGFMKLLESGERS